ncbi:TPA: DUF4365 domain-containing protein [Vibrio parahaemolyticus]|nr:DUF4365 domain-containing protein [Vibrio parahaemolyticus]
MSNRTYAHIIDTKAVKKTLNSLPDTWVVRELTERDYGTDLQVEIYCENGLDKNNRIKYKATGCLLNLQIKGQDKPIKFSSNNSCNFRIKRSSLLHFERFSVPLLLILVDVSNPKSDSFFVWVQKYIKEALDYDVRNWRQMVKRNKKGYVIKDPKYGIKVPHKNSLTNKLKKIEQIAYRAKFYEQALEFIELYEVLMGKLKHIENNNAKVDEQLCHWLSVQSNKISNLTVLLYNNDSGVDIEAIQGLSTCFEDLEQLINEYGSTPSGLPGMPELRLLYSEVTRISTSESFFAKIDNDTPY